MSESHEWLDPQTKAQLAARPPEKLAPPFVGGYSLVLLERGPDRDRVDHVLRELVGDAATVSRTCPFVVLKQLSLADAMQGQFELICADSISVFIDDEVLRDSTKEYREEVFQALRASTEFQAMQIRVESVPSNEVVARFVRQFFGRELPPPFTQLVAWKKARIMQHWGAKIGAVVVCEENRRVGGA